MMNSMKTPQEIAEMISKRFYPLPDADLDSLASIIESSKAAKGELLLDNGQISKYLYYVESGLLRQFYYKNKRDITEHFSCEGNIVICIAITQLQSLVLAGGRTGRHRRTAHNAGL